VRRSLAGLTLLLQPLLASVWDVLFFRHPVTILQGAGAVVTLVAIYLGTIASPAEAGQQPNEVRSQMSE
jgi:drug/metabolite transporter (DMT)-like permease